MEFVLLVVMIPMYFSWFLSLRLHVIWHTSSFSYYLFLLFFLVTEEYKFLYSFLRAAVTKHYNLYFLETYYHIALGARRLKSRHWKAHASSETCREILSCLFWFLVSGWQLAGLGLKLHCSNVSASVTTWCFLCMTVFRLCSYKDSSHKGLEAHPTPV